MKKENQELSKVPIQMLYGVDDRGNLFIINPKKEFNIIRKGLLSEQAFDEDFFMEGLLDSTLEISGDIDTVYSLSQFGDVLEDSLNVILEQELIEFKEMRDHVVNSMRKRKKED